LSESFPLCDEVTVADRYILTPIMTGSAIMVLIALIVNNLSPHRRYPKYWF
jgi:CBS-domain-containing membrane protein